MFSATMSNSSYLQHQPICGLGSFLNEPLSLSYSVDSFDLSLLGFDHDDVTIIEDYSFNNYQDTKIKCENDALSIEIDNCYQYSSHSILKKEKNIQDLYYQRNNSSSSLLSPISPATTVQSSPSPCPCSSIKKEKHSFLPPSPPPSSGVPSPQSIHCENNYKSEMYDEPLFSDEKLLNRTENSLEIKYFFESSEKHEQKQQNYQLLRDFLQDTSFQRKNNLRPLALESIFGLTQQINRDIEPVISLALQHAKQEVQATCKSLNISPDPQQWTAEQVQLWMKTTIKQFKLDPIERIESTFPENGQMFAMLTDEEFIQRAPRIGSILHAQLEIWKAAFLDSSQIDINLLTLSTVGSPSQQNVIGATNLSQTPQWEQKFNTDSEVSEVSDDDSHNSMEIDLSAQIQSNLLKESLKETSTNKSKSSRKQHSNFQKKSVQSSHIHLWQFLKELLVSPQTNGSYIRWLDRPKGIFKIEDSVRVAKLWGKRKNRPAMNYDKLSRSIRQYYKKGIMKKTERSQRLVYQFCHPYSL